ncbi:hypothetical protein LguiA_023730 [Lonicera macranthoides]
MDQNSVPPHVLIFPYPAQGHINSMLKLAELLCLSGLHVTFLVSAKIKDSLIRFTNIQSRFDSYPGFFLESLPETFREIPAHNLVENYNSLKAVSQPFLSDLLIKNRLGSDTRHPVTSIISDGVFSFLIDIAQQIGIPIYYFRTISSCAFWAYFSTKQLIESQELPFQGLDLDVRVSSVQGMEGFLRRRDLPSFCRVGDTRDEALQMLSTETQQTTRADGLILNTFEDLEGPILANIRTKCPNLYTIGPLHKHLKARLPSTSAVQLTSSNSLLEEDKSCMTWLNLQPLKSVLYVSFGSIATLKREELMEIWYGLVNSGQRFLWVRRPNSVAGEDEGEIPVEVVEGTRERGYLVGWAPQEEVLAHPAVGGFLTHSGWNSTLESIIEGVPMICWPYFADQQVNSRFVSEVWKLGLDMKDTCDRVVIENMVRDLMVVRREEFVTVANKTAKLARKSVRKGGSSYSNFDRLVEDMRKAKEPLSDSEANQWAASLDTFRTKSIERPKFLAISLTSTIAEISQGGSRSAEQRLINSRQSLSKVDELQLWD